MTENASRAYWVTAPGQGELRPVDVPSSPPPGHSIVHAIRSGISPGTERLVGNGRVPASDRDVMACPYMDGGFELPVKYGYALVGKVVAGTHMDRRVFAMHPHQEIACVADAHLVILPEDIPTDRATLLPNMETALNAVWDGAPRFDERVVVVGAGPVGLLVAFATHRTTRLPVTIIEPDPDRASLAASLPWVGTVLHPNDAREDADLAFHATGVGAGLQTALDAVGFEGRVIDLSWYGDTPVTLALGTAFHRGRKRIEASQVATVAPSHRGPDDVTRRTDAVLELLRDAALDAIVASPVAFDELPALMRRVYEGKALHPHLVVAYD